MSLTVLVKSASQLPNVERFSKSDPMTVCTVLGESAPLAAYQLNTYVMHLLKREI